MTDKAAEGGQEAQMSLFGVTIVRSFSEAIGRC